MFFEPLHAASKISWLILMLKDLLLCRICCCNGRAVATWLSDKHLSTLKTWDCGKEYGRVMENVHYKHVALFLKRRILNKQAICNKIYLYTGWGGFYIQSCKTCESPLIYTRTFYKFENCHPQFQPCSSAYIKFYCLRYCGGSMVKVLRYKSEGRWFDSRWFHWKFSLT